MGVNKLIVDGVTKFDITDSTVATNNMLDGVIGYNADGVKVTGTLEIGSIIVVTTPETTLYGEDVTITNGITTLTETFNNQGVATFDGVLMTGNLTVSATVGTSTGTKVITVPSFGTYSVVLKLVPNGKTTTPTDDIQTWLKSAQIEGKNYTTLAQVLADVETYERLLSDSNACDYMARSTSWAVGSGQVPTMTSDTTPEGLAFVGPAAVSTYEAYKAFDGDSTTGAHSTSSSQSVGWLGYKFPSAVQINKVNVNFPQASRCPTTVVVQGSNNSTDGADGTWTDLYTVTSVTAQEYTWTFSNNTAYEYYRIYCTGMPSTYTTYGIYVLTLQFCLADIPSFSDAMMRLGKYDYACDALLSDSTWASTIVNSTYFESVLNVSVPKMTSNTTPEGTVSASSVYSSADGYAAYHAFDKNKTTSWYSANWNEQWVEYEFPKAMCIKAYAFFSSPNYYSNGWNISLKASNDHATWDTLDTQTNLTNSDTLILDVSSNENSYKYYRLYVDIVNPGQYNVSSLAAIVQFYGRYEAQTDIIVSASNDTIYYMEDNSMVVLCTTDSQGIGEIDWSDIPPGEITLYSTVAKDVTDLSESYSKTFNITENTTELYLMPINGVLYWYGYNGGMENASPSNGWVGWSYSTDAKFATPTWATNYVYPMATGSNYSAIANKNTVRATKIHSISEITSQGGINVSTGKSIQDSSMVARFATGSGLAHYQSSEFTEQDVYVEPFGVNANGRGTKVYALWYET